MSKKKIDTWMKFFLLCNQSESQHALTRYFYKQFLRYPEERDAFLDSVQRLILDEEDITKAQEYAQRYVTCLSEIFERFGLYKKKCELDDLYFRLTDVQSYDAIESQVTTLLGRYESDIRQTERQLKKICRDIDVECEIKHRRKNTYSIYNKMQRLQTDDMRNIRDLLGFRIVITSDDPADCYKILSHIHDLYKPEITSFKDYIQIPKINGYQSIHTGVYGLWRKPTTPVEIQIKTQRMEQESME